MHSGFFKIDDKDTVPPFRVKVLVTLEDKEVIEEIFTNGSYSFEEIFESIINSPSLQEKLEGKKIKKFEIQTY